MSKFEPKAQTTSFTGRSDAFANAASDHVKVGYKLCHGVGAAYLQGQILSHATYFADAKYLVGRGGLEPPTSRLSGVRSNHLSYRPTIFTPRCKGRVLVEPRRIELLTS